MLAEHAELGTYRLYVDGEPELLFTDNDTNVRRLNGVGRPGYFKDAFHERVIGGNRERGESGAHRHQVRRLAPR